MLTPNVTTVDGEFPALLMRLSLMPLAHQAYFPEEELSSGETGGLTTL
jgi:hypothetical protein